MKDSTEKSRIVQEANAPCKYHEVNPIEDTPREVQEPEAQQSLKPGPKSIRRGPPKKLRNLQSGPGPRRVAASGNVQFTALEIDTPINESDSESSRGMEFATGGEKYNWLWPSVVCPCARRVGNMTVLCETQLKSGDRRLHAVVGPYWPMMAFVTFPVIILVSLLVAVMMLPHMPRPVQVVYWLLTLWVCLALLRVACTDPGIFRRVWKKPSSSQAVWLYSTQGQTWRPKHALYSRDCNVIVEGFDHTCPWTGTAIGKGNLDAFDCFTRSIVVLAFFDILLAVFSAITNAKE